MLFQLLLKFCVGFSLLAFLDADFLLQSVQRRIPVPARGSECRMTLPSEGSRINEKKAETGSRMDQDGHRGAIFSIADFNINSFPWYSYQRKWTKMDQKHYACIHVLQKQSHQHTEAKCTWNWTSAIAFECNIEFERAVFRSNVVCNMSHPLFSCEAFGARLSFFHSVVFFAQSPVYNNKIILYNILYFKNYIDIDHISKKH